MKTLKSIFLFLAIMAFCLAADAQGVGLRMGVTGPPPPATIELGDTFNFNVYVKNDSAFGVRDTLRFGYTINLGGPYFDSNDTSGLMFAVFPDTIRPFDSIVRTIKVTAGAPRFSTGPSVVVIWPIVTNGHHNGQYGFNITVTNPTGIDDGVEEQLKLFVGESGLLIHRDAEVRINKLEIVDVLGREIIDITNPSDNIPLPDMHRGIYMAAITYNDNKRKIFRFYH